MNLYNLPTNEKSPEIVNTVIEIPQGTCVKYEYNAELEVFQMDRVLSSAMVYPTNYGFIPNTLGDDGDPLDVLVYSRQSFVVGSVVECIVLGALDMIDNGKKDYKILTYPVSSVKKRTGLHDISKQFLNITSNFFEHYKDLSKHDVVINDWLSAEEAREIIVSDTIYPSEIVR